LPAWQASEATLRRFNILETFKNLSILTLSPIKRAKKHTQKRVFYSFYRPYILQVFSFGSATNCGIALIFIKYFVERLKNFSKKRKNQLTLL